MLCRRLAVLLVAAFPVSCTAQIAPPSSPASSNGVPPPPTAAQPADPNALNPAAPPVAPTPAQPKITYSQCNVDGSYIAMTYDDGPHATNTPRLLDMLKERNIKATFFMVGQCVAEYPQIVKRMADEGHELANHSWSHPLLSKMSDQGVKDQLQRTHDAIVKATGIQPKTMRPPYGGFTERQRRWSHGELGYKTILWDVDPLDWKVRNAAHVEREILQRTVPGSIILTHDIHKSTVDAMPRTLDALLAKGFKFVTVTELLAMDRPLPPRPRATPGARPKTAPAAPPVETVPSEPVTTSLPVPASAGAVQ